MMERSTLRRPGLAGGALIGLSIGVWLAGGGAADAEAPRAAPVREALEPRAAPELVLRVRDARTGAELDGLELRALPGTLLGATLALPGDDYGVARLGAGLASPIVLGAALPLSGSGRLAALTVRPARGPALERAELGAATSFDRGVALWARTAEHAWGRIDLDLRIGGERELLLEPAAALEVALENLRPQVYAERGRTARLVLRRPAAWWRERHAWVQALEAGASVAGVRLSSLPPDDYELAVELWDQHGWRRRVTLASEALSLAAGERREVRLALAEAPDPRRGAAFAGTLTLPDLPREEEDVVLRLYDAATWTRGPADFELPLEQMRALGGERPTWSWRVDSIPAGRWQAKLWPFGASWMIEQPTGGREDLELVVPQLVEVRVETVDEATGERVPLEALAYGSAERLEGQPNHVGEVARYDGWRALGRFRFRVPPGRLWISTRGIPPGLEQGDRREELEVAGASVEHRLTLAPACGVRFDLREGGARLLHGDELYHRLGQRVRALGHGGCMTRDAAAVDGTIHVSEPGWYEVDLEGFGAGRFLPIPARRVEVRPGSFAELRIDLRRD